MLPGVVDKKVSSNTAVPCPTNPLKPVPALCKARANPGSQLVSQPLTGKPGFTPVGAIPNLALASKAFVPICFTFVTFFTAIAIASFVVNAVGTYGLIFGITCAGTAPTLYNFAAYIVVVYWLGFFTCVFGLVRVVLGRQLAAIVDAAGEMATDAYNTTTMGSQVTLLV